MEYYAIDIDMLNIECYNAEGGEPAIVTAIEYMATAGRTAPESVHEPVSEQVQGERDARSSRA